MQLTVSGKRVIVTGATRGIGRAIAEAFAKEGCRIATCARSEDMLAETEAALRTAGAEDVLTRAVDIRDTDGSRAFVAAVAERWGGIDILVNNAGQGIGGGLATEPEKLLDHANVTIVSHYRFSQAVIPHMRAQRWGRIIDINAMSGVHPSGIGSGINRAACIRLTTALANVVAKDNILVNGLNMGWIDTGQWDRHYREEVPPLVSREKFRHEVQQLVPLGRFGRPEEIAGMVLFLSSDHATYITGATINMAGGLDGQMAYLPTLLRTLNETALSQEAAA